MTSSARRWWKVYYRMLRIVRREHAKVVFDMMAYGQGAMMIPKDSSDPYHVPAKDIPVEWLQSGADAPKE